ncbi:hypothetical protein N866_04315 [Actinotalea ferrariae CF5-4]|uniref:Uncharacterized protein n=1 Tax=Actinotalea ferrariae CF5-4 TaxID=948458 RepID=A0A021VXR6_9CELL|nr:hypothetical protein N866_04315 [Actinotalea ferrariae CF5-4]
MREDAGPLQPEVERFVVRREVGQTVLELGDRAVRDVPVEGESDVPALRRGPAHRRCAGAVERTRSEVDGRQRPGEVLEGRVGRTERGEEAHRHQHARPRPAGPPGARQDRRCARAEA